MMTNIILTSVILAPNFLFLTFCMGKCFEARTINRYEIFHLTYPIQAAAADDATDEPAGSF